MARRSTGRAAQTMAQGGRPQESYSCCMMQIASEKGWQGSAAGMGGERGREPAEFTEEARQSVTESHGHPAPGTHGPQ